MKYLGVSIIIVNYNGKQYLPDIINSIFNMDYPRNRYEVIVVDNNSMDGSKDLLLNKYKKKVKIIALNENKGFAGGNNAGIFSAKYEYIALVNNDGVVDKYWLKELVRSYNMWRSSGVKACASKILFYKKFIEISLFFSVKDYKNSGINFEEIIVNNCNYNKFFKSLAWKRNEIEEEVIRLELKVPISTNTKYVKLKYKKRDSKKIFINVSIFNEDVKQYDIQNREGFLKIKIEKAMLKKAKYIINNCGSGILKNYNGYDIGFGEWDLGQYRERFLHAFCGAAVLLEKSIIKKLGGFDERYFMYYEDTDLSLRLIREGYKIVFVPTSIFYHIHTGSSKEWSYFFKKFVFRNYLFLLTTYGTLYEIYKYMSIFILKRFTRFIIILIKELFRIEVNKNLVKELKLLGFICFSYIYNLPYFLKKRKKWKLKKGDKTL